MSALADPDLHFQARDANNALRYPGRWPGHVESHFIKANSPDGQRAIWIKHTLLSPVQRPDDAVAELWAIAFTERGRRKQAVKRTFPLSALRAVASPFSLSLPSAELRSGYARGVVDRDGARLAWDFTFDPSAPPFRPFALERMYTGSFPRSKSLTPVPDARARGTFSAFGEQWDLTGWRTAQGHNWGASHAHAYAWVHANHWTVEGEHEPLDNTWLEALSGQVKLGPLHTPWLSSAGFYRTGRLHRFDGLRALTSRRVEIDARSYRFELRQGGVVVKGEFHADTEQLAGLRYEDPDGSALACLNSKLARGTLRVLEHGRELVLHTQQAALEIGTRVPGHGVVILA